VECWVDLDVDNEVPRGIEAADGILLVVAGAISCAATAAGLVLLVLSWTA